MRPTKGNTGDRQERGRLFLIVMFLLALVVPTARAANATDAGVAETGTIPLPLSVNRLRTVRSVVNDVQSSRPSANGGLPPK